MTHPAEGEPTPRPAGGTALLGIDIGGTKTVAVLFDGDRRVLSRAQTATPAAEGPDAVVAAAAQVADIVRAAARAQGLRVAAAGVGTAGVVAPDGRTIAAATDALPGWAGTPLAARLESVLGLPVAVLGDVQAFLAGELSAGAAAGAHTAVGVMAGTGIGGALAVGGRVLTGAHGAAGHLGHLPVPGAERLPCPCGRTGHVEAVASGPAMTRLLRAATPEGQRAPDDLRAVAAAAEAGDEEARTVLTRGGTALGTALAGIVSALDPDVVVLAGGVLESGRWYGDALRRAVEEHTLPLLHGVPVTTAALGADAVALGAAEHARETLRPRS
ncbi:ROK family protein [Streptomyces sp. NPDC097595]|uniref:ROK family protein n=1 Tax=Streptomyces sp. NPDC097595 TaxID=3366090 RepID=UPI0037F8BBB4